MKQSKFEYWRAPNGEWRFHLKAPNGKIVCQSEGYRHLAGCMKGIAAVRAATCAPVSELKL